MIRTPQIIGVWAARKDDFYGSFPAQQFLTMLADWLNRIPEEYRDTAEFHVESEEGYEGSHRPVISLRYYRPETESEIVARQTRLLAEETDRRAQYERLRREFER